jgi:transposase-like protein
MLSVGLLLASERRAGVARTLEKPYPYLYLDAMYLKVR